MIDVSLISLKKKLERERALVTQVAQVWEVSAQGLDDGSTIALIIKHMQDAHVARSVWEHLYWVWYLLHQNRISFVSQRLGQPFWHPFLPSLMYRHRPPDNQYSSCNPITKCC
jgi:hypothetical protein